MGYLNFCYFIRLVLLSGDGNTHTHTLSLLIHYVSSKQTDRSFEAAHSSIKGITHPGPVILPVERGPG